MQADSTPSNMTKMITKAMVSGLLPIRDSNSHKGNFGSLLNVSGSDSMCGAAMMSTLASMRIGAGITRLATPLGIAKMIAPFLMEAMTIPLPETASGCVCANSIPVIMSLLEKSTACLVGCGLSCNEDTKSVVAFLLRNAKCRLVIDADGLNAITDSIYLLKSTAQIPIITPHIGEMAKLVNCTIQEVSNKQAKFATEFSVQNNTVVVLKSHNTIVAVPSGEVYENYTGNAGLAKGGSGDVLAGMIAGLSAQGLSCESSAICGVYLHGVAADSLGATMSQYTMLARDIIDEIPFVLKNIGR